MVHLQNSLNLKTSQRQVLTPGLVQMVSVLALNKLELKDMINEEMVENPMLEVLDEAVPLLDEIATREAAQERSAEEVAAAAERVEKDPFDEIDFGSYFQDYLDPGFRTSSSNFEELDSPSFENFLSQPSTLTGHLQWQLGSLSLAPQVRTAAEMILGNLNHDGYLSVDIEELEDLLAAVGADAPLQLQPLAPPAPQSRIIPSMAAADENIPTPRNIPAPQNLDPRFTGALLNGRELNSPAPSAKAADARSSRSAGVAAITQPAQPDHARLIGLPSPERESAQKALAEALRVVQQLDPVGVGARDLRECLLAQIRHQRSEVERAHARHPEPEPEFVEADAENPVTDLEDVPLGTSLAPQPHAASVASQKPQPSVFDAAETIVGKHLQLLQRKDMREIGRAAGCGAEMAQRALDFIRTLDPKPGQRYNQGETRLIEPDVAFVKRGDDYIVVMNEEDMPSLRLSHSYRKLLRKGNAEKEVREYVKERYKSAIQLMRNIEQRKNTILRTCEAIVQRQREFLERGVEHMKPMMIKEVAEEVGVHPSTVSRAVANKYVHTAQGVFELRFFFSEGVNGPEGGATPLMVLKLKVKKLIEDEDPRKPLTDDHLVVLLKQQGIDVTRRTVAKYREDLRIPSTHQRRVRG
ncbi:MAG: RNA polymerase factor sigma-54 [Acidobacteriaceae bacterium]